MLQDFTVLDGQPVVDSLFLSMEMYFLNYSDSPPNILIEIARWTAPLMTASGVLMSISKIRGKILQLLRYYRGDSIAVYGDNIRKEMVQALGSCGIDAGEEWEWVKAKKYLLLGNEDENFRFYGQHREAFAGHTVYLKSENLASEESWIRIYACFVRKKRRPDYIGEGIACMKLPVYKGIICRLYFWDSDF